MVCSKRVYRGNQVNRTENVLRTLSALGFPSKGLRGYFSYQLHCPFIPLADPPHTLHAFAHALFELFAEGRELLLDFCDLHL
jgi:hypothetical protein